MRTIVAAFCGLVSVLTPATTFAQEADLFHPVVEAVRYMRAVQFSDTASVSVSSYGSDLAARVAALLDGVTARPRTESVRCFGAPSTCTIAPDVQGHYQISDVRSPRHGQVVVKLVSSRLGPSKHQPLFSFGVLVDVQLKNGKWVVLGTKPYFIT